MEKQTPVAWLSTVSHFYEQKSCLASTVVSCIGSVNHTTYFLYGIHEYEMVSNF